MNLKAKITTLLALFTLQVPQIRLLKSQVQSCFQMEVIVKPKDEFVTSYAPNHVIEAHRI